ARHRHPSAPAGAAPQLLHVTDLGGAALQQAEGIQVRVLEAVVLALGQRQTSQLRTSIQALAAVMDGGQETPRPSLEAVPAATDDTDDTDDAADLVETADPGPADWPPDIRTC
ncbi:hypothetical protein, partial [Segeticoccus rhizosphaerae]